MPRVWEAPLYLFNYAVDQVTAAFYDRYPNSRATHVISEDVLSLQVTPDQIVTRKLIVKKGAGFLKAAPGWVARRVPAQFMPTLEESVYDRRNQTLTTYTRNVSYLHVMRMDERSVYAPAKDDPGRTSLVRQVYVSVDYGRISGIAEQVFLMAFKKSAKRASEGILERLKEYYGESATGQNSASDGSSPPCRVRRMIKEKLHLDKA